MTSDRKDVVPDAHEPVPVTGEHLGRRLFVGSLFLFVGGWSASVFNFAIGVVIARLLGPETMGFFGLMLSISAVIDILGAISPGLAVVQARRETVQLYDTALAIAVVLASCGLVITALLVPFVVVQKSSLAAWFLFGFAAARFLSFSSQIPIARLERAFQYRAVATINFVGSNVPNVLALTMAWLGAGAWSLLVREVLQPGLILGLGVLVSGYRFRGDITKMTAAEIMSFGRPMFLSRSLEIVLDRADRLVIGGIFGDGSLGLYNQARVLSETGITATRPLGRLSFNLYSRLREEPDRLRRSYGIVNFFLVRLVFSGAIMLLVFPVETIEMLLGAAWVPAAPLLRWLSVYGALLPVFENMKVLLYGRGMVRAAVVLRLVQLALLAIGLLLAFLLNDVTISAVALLFVTVIGVLLAMWWNRDVVAREWIETFAAPIACGTLVAVALLWGPIPAWLRLLPWWALPGVPPVAFVLVLVAVERGKLVGHFKYLRNLARARPE